MGKYFNWDTFIALCSFAAFISAGALSKFESGQSLLAALEVSIAAATASTILGLTVRIWSGMRSGERTLTHIAINLPSQISLTNKLRDIVSSHELLRQILLEIIWLQTDSFAISEHGFRIPSTDWAMQATTSFWKSLYTFSQKPNAPVGTASNIPRILRCHVIHSSEPGMWKTRDAAMSLQAQEVLITHGRGIIERIIVGRLTPDEVEAGVRASMKRHRDISVLKEALSDHNKSLSLAEEYGEIIRLMQAHKIKVGYARGEENGALSDFGLDFARVEVEPSKFITLEWKYLRNTSHVEDCVFSETSSAKTKDLWDALSMKTRFFDRFE